MGYVYPNRVIPIMGGHNKISLTIPTGYGKG